MPNLRAVSAGSPAEFWMPSESRTTAATSAGANVRPTANSAREIEVARPVGANDGNSLGLSSGSAVSANAIVETRNRSSSFFCQAVSFSLARLNRVCPDSSSAMPIEADRSSRKTTAGFSANKLRWVNTGRNSSVTTAKIATHRNAKSKRRCGGFKCPNARR